MSDAEWLIIGIALGYVTSMTARIIFILLKDYVERKT